MDRCGQLYFSQEEQNMFRINTEYIFVYHFKIVTLKMMGENGAGHEVHRKI